MTVTLLLARGTLDGLVAPREQLDEIRRAFASYHGIVSPGRIHAELPHGRGNAVVLMPGLADGIPAYSVKVNAKFPDQRPAIKGAVLLHDLATGGLLAILDAAYVTAARTALAGTLAADLLARADAHTVAIIGAGIQGDLQLRYLSLVRPIGRVLVYDVDAERVARFAAEHAHRLGVPVDVSPDVASAVRAADIVVTATWARMPFLSAAMLRPGTHVTTLGADEPGKAEVDTTVIQQSIAIVDDRTLAMKEGMIAAAGLGPEAISADLGEIVRGDHPGRTAPDQRTVFGAVGLPMLDLVVSWGLYARAQCREDLPRIDLLA